MGDATSSVRIWLQGLFADPQTVLTWPEVRELRKQARFPRTAMHETIRELEFEGKLECDRSSTDPDEWLWRRKGTASREQQTAATEPPEDPGTVRLDRAELMELLDAARRLTHPDVTKGPIAKANDVTARLNAMIDKLRPT